MISKEENILKKQKATECLSNLNSETTGMDLQGNRILAAVGTALVQSEGSHIGCRYLDSSWSTEFPGNSSRKLLALCFELTLVASVLWLCRNNTMSMVKAQDL